MSKASEEALADIHSELAKILKKGMGVLDEEGRPSPSLLNVARQFLKDNHIEVGSLKKGTPMGDLAGLPEFAEDGNVIPFSNHG